MDIEKLAQEAGFKLASGSNWTNVAGTDDNLKQFAELATKLERERADYAWKNTRTIDAARMEEMQKRDKAEAENVLLRQALEPFADIRAAGIEALPDSAGFAARSNGEHVTYGDIRRARELLRSNVELSGPEAALSPEGPARTQG